MSKLLVYVLMELMSFFGEYPMLGIGLHTAGLGMIGGHAHKVDVVAHTHSGPGPVPQTLLAT